MQELTFGYFLYVIGVIIANGILYALIGSLVLIILANILIKIARIGRRKRWMNY